MKFLSNVSRLVETKFPWLVRDPQIGDSTIEPAQLNLADYEALQTQRQREAEKLGQLGLLREVLKKFD